MAKKPNPQILSPENYIRQRARNLPLYKCFINEEWEDMHMTEIIISRRHQNGNVTFCAYLVDTGCLGIKDTFFNFNVPDYELEEMIEDINENEPMMETDYNLVHNIIHAAWEFADEIGFKPHKDFLSITQYMLEEDTDDIPIIEIECGGEDGKPLYVQGPSDTDARVNQIVNQLEKLGEGNYEVVLTADDWDEESFFDADEFNFLDGYSDEYEQNSLRENIEIFFDLYNSIEDPDQNPQAPILLRKLEILTDVLYDEIVSEEEREEWLDKWDEEEENLTFSEVDFFPESLGLTKGQAFTEEDAQRLEEMDDVEELYEFVKERWGEIPYALYLKALKNFDNNKEDAEKRLNRFPEYSLFKIDHLLSKTLEDEATEEECLNYKEIFKNREKIAIFEHNRYLALKFNYFISTLNLAAIDSLYNSLYDLSYDETNAPEQMNALILLARITALHRYLTENFNIEEYNAL